MLEHLLTDNLLVRIFAQPMGWQIWLTWLMIINTAAFLFWRRTEGKVTALVWLGAVAMMMIMYWVVGYVRLLGIVHIIWWTPLFIWLIPRMRRQRPTGGFAVWVWLLIASDLGSLLIDYIDVARYVLGDRAPL